MSLCIGMKASFLEVRSQQISCRLCSGIRQQPQDNPWYTRRSLTLYNLHCLGIASRWRWSTWSGLHLESIDPWGWIAMDHWPFAHLIVESRYLTSNQAACMQGSTLRQIEPGRALLDRWSLWSSSLWSFSQRRSWFNWVASDPPWLACLVCHQHPKMSSK